MVFVRGNPRDFDAWAALGLPDWSYLDCLPYFKRMESFEGGANVYRGANGPLRVQRCKMENPLYGAFLSAGQALGLKFNEDQNGGFQEGVNVAQASIHDGARQSTSVAFLDPVIGRANLTVETGVLVSGLLISGNRVEGVNYTSGGRAVTAIANQVVLSAGAYGTPQLLMLSGIGDPDHLEAVGVTTRGRLTMASPLTRSSAGGLCGGSGPSLGPATTRSAPVVWAPTTWRSQTAMVAFTELKVFVSWTHH
jgi:choline dehydrogenase